MLIVGILSLIGLVLVVKALSAIVGGLVMYLTNPFMVREAVVQIQLGTLSEYNYLFSIGSYLLSLQYIMSILGGVLYTAPKRIRWLSYLPLVLAILSGLVFLKRYSVITNIFFWALAAYFTSYFTDRINRKRLLISVSLVLVVLVGTFIGFSFLVLNLRMFYLKDVTGLIIQTVVAYFSGTISALELFIRTFNDHLYGQSLFRSILKWLSRIGLWEPGAVIPVHNKWVNIGSLHINTYTYVKTLYEDFGVVGTTLGSALWGSLTYWITNRLLTREFSLVRLTLTVVFCFSLFMSFYAFYFEGLTNILLWLIVIYVIDRMAAPRIIFDDYKLAQQAGRNPV